MELNVTTSEQLRDLIFGAVHEAMNVIPPRQVEPKPEKFHTRKEVAKQLKISLPTLNDWSKRGLIKSYMIGGRVLYKANEIEQSLNQVKTVKY